MKWQKNALGFFSTSKLANQVDPIAKTVLSLRLQTGQTYSTRPDCSARKHQLLRALSLSPLRIYRWPGFWLRTAHAKVVPCTVLVAAFIADISFAYLIMRGILLHHATLFALKKTIATTGVCTPYGNNGCCA